MAVLTSKPLTVAEAMNKLLATVNPLEVIEQRLSESLNLTLSEDIVSPIDSPPFDKSAMDGYAVKAIDLATGIANLQVIEVIAAGHLPTRSIQSGEASQIMTGAALPEGADAVIKVEETQQVSDRVSISTAAPSPGLNVIRRGNSTKRGDLVLNSGMTLNGSRIGALAELGCATVRVRRRPRIAILATGDELIPVEETPQPGQIRNSNASMLFAQILSAGGIPTSLGIARDNPHELLEKIREGIQFDALILSGGVSAGILDLVPAALNQAGVREIFHKVEMKPGKPIWFGAVNSSDQKTSCYVFGLPGNPVSSLVCCELFVRTAIRRMMGVEPATPQPMLAEIEHDYATNADRPTYHPARLTWTREGLAISLVPWRGSSDLCSTVAANGMAFLSGEPTQYRTGDRIETYLW